MEDCEIQLNETVASVSNSYLYNDIGKLILEELRSFRKEMKEEVQKLNENVQNFLFSKADVVNALLGSSPMFNEIDQSLSNAFDKQMPIQEQHKPRMMEKNSLPPIHQSSLVKLKPLANIAPQLSNGKLTSQSTISAFDKYSSKLLHTSNASSDQVSDEINKDYARNQINQRT